METLRLTEFFKSIEEDARIGVSHISLYCALFQLAILQESNTVYFNSYELMGIAKISGSATYHRCMKNLHEYGYIQYRPSYNHYKKKSRVTIYTKLELKRSNTHLDRYKQNPAHEAYI